MTLIKRTLLLLLSVMLLAAAALGVYVYRSFPAVDGEVTAIGLRAAVVVSRDAADVTHLTAASPQDLWFSLGYVHAQERGWQLEFNRRVMHGELSEVLGPATLDTDRLLRTLGIMQAAEQQWQRLPATGRDALQAYSNGISAFYASTPQALPPEFHILGTRPGGSGVPWSPQDSVGWMLMMALDLGGNWGTEFARLSAARSVDNATLWQLFPPYPGEPPASAVDLPRLYAGLGVYRSRAPSATKSIAAPARVSGAAGLFDTQKELGTMQAMAAGVNDWAAALGVVEGKGSNNWVVAGNHTVSGKPLLANDPHLGLSAPAIWYVAHLQAPAGTASDGSAVAAIDAVGATLPGLPFVVLGRTREVAWTFTNTGPDVQDLYLEQLDPARPDHYRVPLAGGGTAWATFGTRRETIRVKGRDDVVITVRHTRHGPVLSDVQKPHADLLDTARYVTALRWSALDADNQTVLAGLRANQAHSVADVLDAFASYHSPMQNMVAADTAGQVAFKAVGKVPLRRADNDIRGVAPSPGWDARYDWDGWLPYSQSPEAGNAAIEATGWLSTANQRITPPGYPVFMGQDWAFPYRQDRIAALLAASPRHDMGSMQAIQRDQLSLSTVRLLPMLKQAAAALPAQPLSGQVQAMLQGFDGAMRADGPAPLVFAAWADELTRSVLGRQLDADLLASLYGKRHFRSTLEDVLLRNDRAWCGGDCAAEARAALERALTRLQTDYGADVNEWQWGRAHEALSAHRPFASVAP
ncbi:MAG: penicillin acylase family protein, partial [Polaromonas sp.]|nr:penicillin acylase family protein [Polaromonas sp.]